jgi:hypothetical protein
MAEYEGKEDELPYVDHVLTRVHGKNELDFSF